MNYALANPLGGLTLPAPARVAVTVSVIALDDQRRIILHRRGPTGPWAIPGDHLAAGESVEQAALRCFHAVTRCKIRVTYLLGIYSDPMDRLVQDPVDDEIVHEVNILLEAHLLHPAAPFMAPAMSPSVGFFHPEHLPSPLLQSSVGPLQNYLHGHVGIIR